ncbi:hypothetical protein ACQCVE_15015 [Metabacillus sp. 113a]|uniref:hypothetical protein n=1 Tax=Metabacillus sp. 113a TaxID=3404706 RepID=UPI003CE7F384
MKKWTIGILLNLLIFALLIFSIRQLGNMDKEPVRVAVFWTVAAFLIAGTGHILTKRTSEERHAFWLVFLAGFAAIGICMFFIY